jgi:hypothetical protein
MKGQPLTAAWEIFQKKLAGMPRRRTGKPRSGKALRNDHNLMP